MVEVRFTLGDVTRVAGEHSEGRDGCFSVRGGQNRSNSDLIGEGAVK